jgi:thiol-disulfide isomerase/thioredoxin
MPSSVYADLTLFEIATKPANTKKRLLKDVILSSQLPVMVMVWGINCKPCLEESKVISIIATHFKKKLDFLALQIEDDIDPRAINSSTANERFSKMASTLLPFGVKRDKIPKPFVVANDISDTWNALLALDKDFKDVKHQSSIPLFILYDKEKKIKKIWTASIAEEFSTLDDFIHKLKK